MDCLHEWHVLNPASRSSNGNAVSFALHIPPCFAVLTLNRFRVYSIAAAVETPEKDRRNCTKDKGNFQRWSLGRIQD